MKNKIDSSVQSYENESRGLIIQMWSGVLFRIRPAATNDAEFICGWKAFNAAGTMTLDAAGRKKFPINLPAAPFLAVNAKRHECLSAAFVIPPGVPFVLQIKMMSHRDRSRY